MTKLTLRWRDFWIGAGCLFAIVFWINAHLYVMQDVLPQASGTMIGAFGGSWLVWLATKRVMGRERVPQARYFILVLSCICILAAIAGLPWWWYGVAAILWLARLAFLHDYLTSLPR